MNRSTPLCESFTGGNWRADKFCRRDWFLFTTACRRGIAFSQLRARRLFVVFFRWSRRSGSNQPARTSWVSGEAIDFAPRRRIPNAHLVAGREEQKWPLRLHAKLLWRNRN